MSLFFIKIIIATLKANRIARNQEKNKKSLPDNLYFLSSFSLFVYSNKSLPVNQVLFMEN